MMLTYSNRLFTDAFERSVSNSVYQGYEPLSLKQGIFKVAKAISKAAKATGRFISEALIAQAEARARDMGYSDLLKKDF